MTYIAPNVCSCIDLVFKKGNEIEIEQQTIKTSSTSPLRKHLPISTRFKYGGKEQQMKTETSTLKKTRRIQKYILGKQEYQFILEYGYALFCKVNAEYQMQATLLGVAKEAATIAEYWSKEVDRITKEFIESAVITALM